MLATPFMTQPPTAVGDSIVLHLKLYEGSAFDYSLNSHPGTLNGTATYKYPGVDLDGDSDYIEIADSDDFSFGDGSNDKPFSISAWVNMDDSENFKIISKGIKDTAGEWTFEINLNHRLILFLYDQSEADTFVSEFGTSFEPYEGQFIYLVATYDGRGGATAENGITLYVNGVSFSTTTYKSGTYTAMENGIAPVYIGRADSTKYANGKIDDVMVFNKELSAPEVKSIYSTTRRRYGV